MIFNSKFSWPDHSQPDLGLMALQFQFCSGQHRRRLVTMFVVF